MKEMDKGYITFTYDSDIDKLEPAETSPSTNNANDNSVAPQIEAVDTAATVDAEVASTQVEAEQATIDTAELAAAVADLDRPVSENFDETDIQTAAPQATADEAGRAELKADKTQAKKCKPKSTEPQYVTKKFFIVCLIVAVVVSTVLASSIALLVKGNSTTTKRHSNLSESSQSAATGSALTVSEIIEKNADAVVEIVVSSSSTNYFGQTQISEGAGSGVIVNEKGFIVTNYHVIEGANSVTVTLHNGDSYGASIIGTDEDNDIAVIKISASGLTPVTMGDSSAVAVGDLAVAIGNPLGQLGGTATSGIISALDRTLTIDDRTLSLLQTDAAINPGNSGGGLFNGAGELIGIVDAKSSGSDVEGLAFAIPINSVKDQIDEIISTGKSTAKASIGISIYDVSDQNANYYNLNGEGVYIAEITGKNAEKAGFKVNDKVISFNGKKIKSAEDLITKVKACKVGDTATVVVERDGQEITIKTELEDSLNTQSSQQTQQQQQQDEYSQGGGSIEDFFEEFGF